MPVTKKISLTLKGGLHPADAVRVQMSGPGAAKIKIEELKKKIVKALNSRFKPNTPLTSEHIFSHYRLEEPYQLYLRVAEKSPLKPTEIYGQVFANLGGGLTEVKLSHPRFEETRIFLNFCPPELNTDQETIKQLTDVVLPPSTEHHTIFRKVQGREDRNLIIAAIPRQDLVEVPHYLEYEVEGIKKTITVTIPGRMPLCPTCETAVHTGNDCPAAVKKIPDQKTSKATSEAQTDVSWQTTEYVSLTKEKKKKQRTKPTQTTEIEQKSKEIQTETIEQEQEFQTPPPPKSPAVVEEQKVAGNGNLNSRWSRQMPSLRPRSDAVVTSLGFQGVASSGHANMEQTVVSSPAKKQRIGEGIRMCITGQVPNLHDETTYQRLCPQKFTFSYAQMKAWKPAFFLGDEGLMLKYDSKLPRIFDQEPAGRLFYNSSGVYGGKQLLWLKKCVSETGEAFYRQPDLAEIPSDSMVWKLFPHERY